LRALPQADVRRLPGPPRRQGLHALRLQGGLPPLAGAPRDRGATAWSLSSRRRGSCSPPRPSSWGGSRPRAAGAARPPRRPARADAVTELLRRQIEAVRAEGREGQEAVRREVGDLALRMRGDLGDLQQSVATELKSVSTEVTHQLHEGMKLFQTAQTTMGERLDRAARVVSEVQGSLGKLGEATQRVVEVGKDIQGLEQILKSPKVRGGLGETLLAELLSQMLPQEHYALQHPFKSGERVDAALRIGDRLVAVDAKFPLENFRRMLDEAEDDRRRPVRRQFVRDVKTRIDEIAKKYILPDEGTYDFALMYVPAENV